MLDTSERRNMQQKKIWELLRWENKKRLFRELRDEADRLEDKMFISYSHLKQNEKIFGQSQNFLQLSIIIKFIINVMIAIVQAVLMVKLLGKYREKYSQMI